MKIYFIVSNLTYGGIHRVVSSLSEELEKNGNDVSVLCNAPNYSFFKLKYSINDAPLFKRLYRYGYIIFKMVLIEIFGRFVYKKKLSSCKSLYKYN